MLDSFVAKLNNHVAFIAEDKPEAASKFKDDILQLLKDLPRFPYKHRKSIYFENDQLRDLIYKGFTIIYQVDEAKQTIQVFALLKWEENP